MPGVGSPGRRIARRVAVAVATAFVLLPAAGASPHPGHGAILVTVGSLRFAPQQVNVYQGDTVFWNYAGPDTNHTVTADPGQAESFESDPGVAPAQVSHDTSYGFSHRFDNVGTFTYHCRVHSFMTGTVVVAPAPATPPPGPAPAKLAVTALSVSPTSFRRRHAVRVTVAYTLNLAASVRVTVHGTGRASRLGQEYDFPGPPGASRQPLSLGRLRPGRYRIEVIAINNTDGSSTAPADVTFRVR